METQIPFTHWSPLSLEAVQILFTNAPFQWAIAGGYAVEQFLGHSLRPHADIDVALFRDDQLKVQHWLQGWTLYAADPPGSLRPWQPEEFLPYGIHDIWGHKVGAEAWQLQLMLCESEGQEWFSRRNPLIRGKRDDLIVQYNGLPCLRIEVQLMYKANNHRPKDDLDFEACLPLLSNETSTWLKAQLTLLYPQGHPWLSAL